MSLHRMLAIIKPALLPAGNMDGHTLCMTLCCHNCRKSLLLLLLLLLTVATAAIVAATAAMAAVAADTLADSNDILVVTWL